MALVLWQLEVFHVNPLFAIFGYKFFEAKSENVRVLVLSRTKPLVGGNLFVIRLSEYIWIHCEGRSDGSVAVDASAGRNTGSSY